MSDKVELNSGATKKLGEFGSNIQKKMAQSMSIGEYYSFAKSI